MQQPILFSMEPNAEPDAEWARCQQALAVGFSGFERVLGGPTGDQRPPFERDEQTVVVAAAGCVSTEIEDGVAEVLSLLRRAAMCHARCLNLTLPPVTAESSVTGFARYQDGINFVSRLLLELRYEAESLGVAIAVEAAAGGCLLSPVELREMMDQANSPAIGVCLDVPRVARIGLPEDWIATLGHRIQALRVEVTEPLHGNVPSTTADDLSIDTALELIGYKGPVIVSGRGSPEQLWSRISNLQPDKRGS